MDGHADIRADCGSAGTEYAVIASLVVAGALGLGLAYRSWLTSSFGEEIGPDGGGLIGVLSAWGGQSALSPATATGVGAVGLASVLALIVLSRAEARKSRRSTRWIAVVLIALASAAVLAGFRIGLRVLGESAIGLPSTGTLVAIAVVIAALCGGAVVGWFVRASTHLESVFAGGVAGLVVAMSGQVITLSQGTMPDTRYMLMMGCVVLLSITGSFVGSTFALAEVDGV